MKSVCDFLGTNESPEVASPQTDPLVLPVSLVGKDALCLFRTVCARTKRARAARRPRNRFDGGRVQFDFSQKVGQINLQSHGDPCNRDQTGVGLTSFELTERTTIDICESRESLLRMAFSFSQFPHAIAELQLNRGFVHPRHLTRNSAYVHAIYIPGILTSAVLRRKVGSSGRR